MARPTSEAARRGRRPDPSAPIRVLVVVPNGTHRPGALGAAVLAHHPAWTVVAAWCGDPQLRPVDPGVAWLSEVAPSSTDALTVEPAVLEQRVALDGCAALLARGPGPVIVLQAGSIAVLGPLDDLVPADGELLRLVPRLLDAPPVDGLVPDLAATMAAGWFSTTVWSAGAGAGELVGRLRAVADLDLARELERLAARADVGVCRSARIGAGPWRWTEDDAPHLLDLPAFDSSRPWSLTPDEDREARIGVADHDARRAALDLASAQLAGQRRPVRLAGGVQVDDDVRHALVLATEHDTGRVDPTGLERTYWAALHERRPDLQAAFPAGPGSEPFARWASSSFAADTMPFLVPLPSPAVPAPPRITVDEPPREGGVNVVGYLTRASSLGGVGRRLVDLCRAAGIPVSTIDHTRTQSPPAPDAPPVDDVVRYADTIAMVNADQFDGLLTDVPGLRGAGRRLIAYWFWEVAHVPPVMRAALAQVDEVWAGTRFVAEAIAAESPVPVRLVPLPVQRPTPSSLDARTLAPWYDHRGRFTFLVTFDHLSVMARKNPLAAIDAYRRAFPDGSQTLLVVRTTNAELRPAAHDELLEAAAGREDIRVWDRPMAFTDLMAVVRDADCVVSLHRSEGLGLHLIEAMWLGTPTIATRWSGNVDFMDDGNSLLVDAELVPVRGGDRVYSPLAEWAEPDLDQAAAAMRRIVHEDGLAARLADAALATMQGLADPAPATALLRDLLPRAVAG